MNKRQKSKVINCCEEVLAPARKETIRAILSLAPWSAQFLKTTNLELELQDGIRVLEFINQNYKKKQVRRGHVLTILYPDAYLLLIIHLITNSDDGCYSDEIIMRFFAGVLSEIIMDIGALLDEEACTKLVFTSGQTFMPDIYFFGTLKPYEWALLKFAASLHQQQ